MKILHDIEVFPNFFCTTVYDYDTKERIVFEISERKNHLVEMVNFYKSIRGFLISFNGVHYDSPIMKFIIVNCDKFKEMPFQHICWAIQDFSNTIINLDFWWKDNKLKKYKYNHSWIDLDLFLYWARMTRISKRISLKSLGIQLKYPVVQELPYPPNKDLPGVEAMDKIVEYNSIHDINILELLLESPIRWQGKLTSMIEKIKLKKEIRNKFTLPKAIYSWDDTKIASELFARFIGKKIGSDFKDKRTYYSSIELKDIIIPNIFFVNKKIDFITKKLKKGSSKYKILCFNPNTLLHLLNKQEVTSTGEIDYTVRFINSDSTCLMCDIGSGGIHGIIADNIIQENNKEEILDFDIASMYPSLIIEYGFAPEHLGKVFLDTYTQIRDMRIEAKKAGNKTMDASGKLMLNSTYGLMQNDFSYLKDMKAVLSITVNGQLIILNLIEQLIENGHNVVYANTDGVTIKTKDSDNAREIVEKHGKLFRMTWEEDCFKTMYVRDVNNFINIKCDNKVKKKGIFVTEPDIGNSTNNMVIPLAIEAYFTKGIPIKDFILNHRDILDFCASQKVDKSYTITWNNKEQQRLNRYYVSTDGAYLYKNRKGKTTNMLKGWGVTIYNNHVPKKMSEYNINYTYYIQQCDNIIQELIGTPTLF